MTTTVEQTETVEPEPQIGSIELCERAGITYRQLDVWCQRGILRNSAHGSGSARTFTEDDVRLAATISALLRQGFDLATAIGHARQLDERGSVQSVDPRITVLVLRTPPGALPEENPNPEAHA